ncbi:hypothetical protein QA612_19965 [Evansella sp. AB-P1]|uniref:hypothetical protein n=1 Tax=Evansella sp. AB-P1 TaxID=3037653 RepID=UPI00241D9AAE|nr:hypothetical protein [Evansella sp. AB-P1]MDG5789738.1 hypothetical protein [Evansella sp. AB-P1]
MIQADTIVHFYYDLENENEYEATVTNYLNGLRDPLRTKEIISIGDPFMSKTGFTVRVAVRFNVLLDERKSCRHLDDYVSFVFPTVKNNIAGELISTQNLHLTYVRNQAQPKEKKINWEELESWGRF